MPGKYVTTAITAILTVTALCPAGAEEVEYDGGVKWSVDVPEIETTLYDYLTKERTHKAYSDVKVHGAPRWSSDVVGVLHKDDEFAVVEAYAAWSEEPAPDYLSEDPGPAYFSAYKIESAGLEGWVFWGVPGVRRLVRFEEEYSPLREGPSPEYRPLTREEERGLDWGEDWLRLKSTVEAGSIYEPLYIFGDWMCVGRETSIVLNAAGGWLPVNTAGLEFYVPAFGANVWEYMNIGGSMDFFVPCGFPSSTIIESVSLYACSELTNDYIIVTAVDRKGAEHVFEPGDYCGYPMGGGPDWGAAYREFKTDNPVDWTEVEKVYVILNEPLLLEDDEFAFDFPNERLPKE